MRCQWGALKMVMAIGNRGAGSKASMYSLYHWRWKYCWRSRWTMNIPGSGCVGSPTVVVTLSTLARWPSIAMWWRWMHSLQCAMDKLVAEHYSGGDDCLKDDQTTKDEVHTAEILELILHKFKMKIPCKAPSKMRVHLMKIIGDWLGCLEIHLYTLLKLLLRMVIIILIGGGRRSGGREDIVVQQHNNHQVFEISER